MENGRVRSNRTGCCLGYPHSVISGDGYLWDWYLFYLSIWHYATADL